MTEPDEVEVDLTEALGASESLSTQVLTLYIPDRDRSGNELGTQRGWVMEAASMLAAIGGGVTIMPPVEGGWLNDAEQRIIWEHPVLLYTYVRPREFLQTLPRLRSFLHRLGRETNQGEVAVEFGGQFYRIVDYDEGDEQRDDTHSE